MTHPVLREMRGNTILDEAHAIVHGDRQDAYGHPFDNWTQTAEILSGILRPVLKDGSTISAEMAILCMIGVKLARLGRSLKRDSIVDVAGYAALLEFIPGRDEPAVSPASDGA